MLVFTVRQRAHGNLLVTEFHGASDSCAGTCVNLTDVRIGDHGFHAGSGEFTACHYGNPAFSMLDELSKRGHGIHGAFLSSRGEYSRRADFNQIIERMVEVTGHIKGPMAGYFERTRHFDQLPHPYFVDCAVDVQYAKDYPAGAELPGDQDVSLHDAEFVRGVAEVATARTKHDVQSYLYFLTHRSDHARAGRGATFRQTGAKLHAVCSAMLRSYGGFHGVQTYFQQNRAFADLRLRYHTRHRFSRAMGCPALQLKACWNSGMFTTTPLIRYFPG